MKSIFPILLVCFLLMACDPAGGAGRSERRNAELDALADANAETEKLRLAYCELLHLLYGNSAKCVDGGRVILDQERQRAAGVIFDGDIGEGAANYRYLLCLRESAGGDNGMAMVDGLVAQLVDGKWQRKAEGKDLLQMPVLDLIRVERSTPAPVVKLGYKDADGAPDSVFIQFSQGAVARVEQLEAVATEPVPACLGLEAGESLASLAAEPADEKDFLKTNFERLIASKFALEAETHITDGIDSTSRQYSLGETKAQVGHMLFSDGEITRIALSGPLCEGGMPELFRILQALYPQLARFSLEANNLFSVSLDYEDFRVSREAGKVKGFLYNAFQEGRQYQISLETTADGYLFDMQVYFI